MPKFVKVLLLTSLALCAATYGRAELLPNLHVTDNKEAAQAVEMKGDLARAHNDLYAAIAYYQKALRFNPQNTDLYNKLGIAEFQIKNTRAARKYFSQAVKYDSRNAIALNNLGALSVVDKKYKQAIGYLKQALALDELCASAHLNIAEAWMGLGEIDHAMTEYSRALELNPDILAGGENGIVAQIKTPEQRARINYLIAKAYAKRGNMEGALEYLRRAKEGHYPELSKVYSDQEFASLWQDPRLAKIVKR